MNDNSQPLKQIIEAALFAAGEPISIDKIVALFSQNKVPEKKDVRQALLALKQDYQDHGVELKEVASGWQFQVKQEFSPWIKQLWKIPAPRYSRALMETLALIAYKQPITRAEIEQVRGVSVSSQIVRTLEDHGWIRQIGHKDVPGKPALLATTKQFLDHFGMKTLNELPQLSDIHDLDAIGENLQKQLELEQDEPKQNNRQTNDASDQSDITQQNERQTSDAESEGLPVHLYDQQINKTEKEQSINKEPANEQSDAESEGWPVHTYDDKNKS